MRISSWYHGETTLAWRLLDLARLFSSSRCGVGETPIWRAQSQHVHRQCLVTRLNLPGCPKGLATTGTQHLKRAFCPTAFISKPCHRRTDGIALLWELPLSRPARCRSPAGIRVPVWRRRLSQLCVIGVATNLEVVTSPAGLTSTTPSAKASATSRSASRDDA